MVYTSGTVVASSAATAYYRYRAAEVVTSSGSATQTGPTLEEAFDLAGFVAQNVADTAATSFAETSIQTNNSATNNSRHYYLSSSLYFQTDGANGTGNILSSNIFPHPDSNPQLTRVAIPLPTSYTLTSSYTITPGQTLVIENGQSLTISLGKTKIISSGSNIYIAPGGTLINNGTISIASGGTLFNNGTIINSGTINNTIDTNGNEFGYIINGGVFNNLELSISTTLTPSGEVIFNNNGTVMGAFNIQNGIPYTSPLPYTFTINNCIAQAGAGTFNITNGGNFNCYGPIINGYSFINPTPSTFNFTGNSFTTNSPIYNYGIASSTNNICTMTFNVTGDPLNPTGFSSTSSINNIGNFTINSNTSPIILNTINNGSFTLNNVTNYGEANFTVNSSGPCTCNGIINNGYIGNPTSGFLTSFSFTGTFFTAISPINNFTSNSMNNIGEINIVGQLFLYGSSALINNGTTDNILAFQGAEIFFATFSVTGATICNMSTTINNGYSGNTLGDGAITFSYTANNSFNNGGTINNYSNCNMYFYTTLTNVGTISNYGYITADIFDVPPNIQASPKTVIT